MPDGTAARTGDLFVDVHVQPHPLFRREGDDLHLVVPIGVHEAVLGARIDVPTLEGPVELRPAGHAGGTAVPDERARRAARGRRPRRPDRRSPARAAGDRGRAIEAN